MKTLKYISYIMVIVLMTVFASCSDDYEIGQPYDKVAGTVGEWSVKTVTLVNAEDEELDITSYFDFSTLGIHLAADKQFTISGNAPNYLGVTSGTWALDNESTPMYIELTQASTKAQLNFVAPPREGTNLKVRVDRKKGDEVYASYVYELTKQ